jgi:hypothetical protein
VAGVTPQQVQVVWLKQALIGPANYGVFPAHAQMLQADVETIIRNIKSHCDPLANPTLELHNSSEATIATNDDWQTTQIGSVITSDRVPRLCSSASRVFWLTGLWNCTTAMAQ